MSNQKQSAVFVFALLLAIPAGAQVQIEMRAEAVVDSGEIRLADIAVIRSESARSKAALQQLDVGQLKEGRDSLTIRQTLVAIRLQLAGWSSDDFQIGGAKTTQVARRLYEPVTDSAIEAAAVNTMRTTLNVPPTELRVRLTSPFMGTLPKAVQSKSN